MARTDVPVIAKGAPAPRITLERAAEAVRAQLPNLEPSFVQLPNNAYRPYQRRWARQLSADFRDGGGQSLQRQGGADAACLRPSALELVTDSMRPLHTGDFARVWL